MSNAVRRALLYGAAAAVVWGGSRAHSSLSAAALRPAPSLGPSVVEGALGLRLIPEALRDAGCGAAEAAALAHAAGRALDARRLRPDDRFRLVRGADGAFMHLTLAHGERRAVVTPSPGGGLRATSRRDPVAVAERRAAGEINGSLWLSMEAAGVPAEVIVRFAEAFQWTVDFLAETRDGDRFSVAWTERAAAGRTLSRTVAAGAYDGKATGERTAVLFDGEYYDAAGESLRRMFLRAPLKFARVSYRFDRNRRHPILRVNRPHHGTDYAAAQGTPVSTVAGGVVVAAHRERGFGNVVKIRHDGVYTTLYAHLSRFGRGIRKGVRVEQGRVIGFVGSTGLSTGPHLHFQIEKNGRWADFLALDLPFAHSVAKTRRAAFAAARDRLLSELTFRRSTAQNSPPRGGT
ncbi:MAG: M23 family metallopeptidase [Elusimicrobia bacterium]|nr:M23 family metallopeptidase [Elusimicrobiota bacterium]